MSTDDISARAARLAEMIMPELEEKSGCGKDGCLADFYANKPLFYGSIALVGLAVIGGVTWAVLDHNKKQAAAARRKQQQKGAFVASSVRRS